MVFNFFSNPEARGQKQSSQSRAEGSRTRARPAAGPTPRSDDLLHRFVAPPERAADLRARHPHPLLPIPYQRPSVLCGMILFLGIKNPDARRQPEQRPQARRGKTRADRPYNNERPFSSTASVNAEHGAGWGGMKRNSPSIRMATSC
jgi:hypothetical protein